MSTNNDINTIFNNYCKENGWDYNEINKIITMSYDAYMKQLKENLEEMNDEDESLTEDDYERLELTRDRYREYRENLANIKRQMERLILEEQNAPKEWQFPYKELFNGIFPKIDKSILTEEMKRAYNVHGLQDDQYDLYYNKQFKKVIPIYYDTSTLNENFYIFTVYLEEYKKRTNRPNINHMIPLILFDRTLMHIDTDVETLSKEILGRIVMEVKRNPFFYFRECARILKTGTNETVRYQMTIKSYIFLWLYCQRINSHQEAPRQTGKTFDINNVGGYEFACGSENAMSLIVHFKSEEAGKNRKSMVDAANLIKPKALRFHTVQRQVKRGEVIWKDGEDMVAAIKPKTVTNEFLSNTLKIVAVGQTETSAEQAGRGDTIRFAFIDELNYIKQADTVLTAVQFAHGTAHILAEKANLRNGLFFSSTAGELTTKHGRRMWEMTHNDMCKFEMNLLEYSYNDLITYLKKNSRKHFFYLTFAYNELGFDEEWLDKTLAQGAPKHEFQKDILNMWLAVNPDSIFSPSIINRIAGYAERTPVGTIMFEKYTPIKFFPQHEGQTFEELIKSTNAMSLGLDIAQGQGLDSSVLFMVNLENGRPVGYYKHNTHGVLDLCVLIPELIRYMRRLNPNIKMILVPEQEGPGITFISAVKEMKDIEPLIFNTVKYNDPKVKNPIIKKTQKRLNNEITIDYGTQMRKVRDYLTRTLLFDMVEKYPYAFCCDDAFQELSTLRQKPSGKIEHKAGFHDDMIMAILHAYSLIFYKPYRDRLDEHFNFIVDFRKIQAMPLTSHIVSYDNIEKNNDIEGKVEYRIVSARDEYGEVYDRIIMSKVVNGIKVMLDDDQIQSELDRLDLRGNIDIMMMRLKKVRTNEISHKKEKEQVALDELSWTGNTKIKKRNDDMSVALENYLAANGITQIGDRRIEPEWDTNTGMGAELSRDDRIGSREYLKKNKNNYKARLC